MANTKIEFIGLKELKAAVKRSPRQVKRSAQVFLTRGMAAYKRSIINQPWRIGGSGGGAPVSNDPRYPRPAQRQRSGTLRDSHITRVGTLQAEIGPDPNGQAAKYMHYVHNGTRRMQARPWLDDAKEQNESRIAKLYSTMLKEITRDLAK